VKRGKYTCKDIPPGVPIIPWLEGANRKDRRRRKSLERRRAKKEAIRNARSASKDCMVLTKEQVQALRRHYNNEA